MNRRILLLLPGLLSFLTSCSTYSAKQCREMDWYREGRDAALNGYTPKQAKTHYIDKCHEAKGVPVENVAFERGFTQGLNELCSPEGLEKLSRQGIKYQQTCESHEDSVQFQKTRTGGMEERIRDLEAEVKRLTAEKESLAAEVEALKSNGAE